MKLRSIDWRTGVRTAAFAGVAGLQWLTANAGEALLFCSRGFKVLREHLRQPNKSKG